MRGRTSTYALALAVAFSLVQVIWTAGAFAVSGAMTSGLPAAPMQSSLLSKVQYGPGGLVDPDRRCQTIRTCRYERGGSYRGCLSTYTCRVCKLVPAKCDIGGRSENCREMRCTWGG